MIDRAEAERAAREAGDKDASTKITRLPAVGDYKGEPSSEVSKDLQDLV